MLFVHYDQPPIIDAENLKFPPCMVSDTALGLDHVHNAATGVFELNWVSSSTSSLQRDEGVTAPRLQHHKCTSVCIKWARIEAIIFESTAS